MEAPNVMMEHRRNQSGEDWRSVCEDRSGRLVVMLNEPNLLSSDVLTVSPSEGYINSDAVASGIRDKRFLIGDRRS
jgi:hypothetical protein